MTSLNQFPEEEHIEERLINFNRENMFTLITIKEEKNLKNFHPVEIISELFLKYYSIKYKKIEYFDNQVGQYYGKLPVLVADKSIVSTRCIVRFISQIIIESQSSFWDNFEQFIFILQDIFRLSLEYLLFLKEKKNNQKSKNIFRKILNYFSGDKYYENNVKAFFDKFSYLNDSNNYYMSTEEKAKTMILHSYDMVIKLYYAEIKNASRYDDFIKREMLFNLIAYAFIKDEIDNPSLVSSNNYDHINKFKSDVINYIEKKIFGLINTKPLLYEDYSFTIFKQLAEKNSKKTFKIKKDKDTIDLIEQRSWENVFTNIKQLLLFTAVFIGFTAYRYYEECEKEKDPNLRYDRPISDITQHFERRD